MRISVMAAQETLNLRVWVRILDPQLCSSEKRVTSPGYASYVGSNPALGREAQMM